jgi:hypothetical protein
MDALLAILHELNRPSSHISFNPLTKQAKLRDGDKILPISAKDLEILFANGWIMKYDGSNGEHYYRLTQTGRNAVHGW